MKSDLYFDECKECMWREHNNDLFMCLSNRLHLAFFELVADFKLTDDVYYCRGFEKEVENGTIEADLW